MALTPEQVINKTFQPTKFREGYDQEEVDLFLDEVVAELRRLEKENEELRQRLREAGLSDSLDSEGHDHASAGEAEPGTVAALNVQDDSSVSTPVEEERSETVEEEVVPVPAEIRPGSQGTDDERTEDEGLESTSYETEQDLAPAGDAREENAQATRLPEDGFAQDADAEDEPTEVPTAAAPAQPYSTTESAQSAAAVIAMAQRLHDEYVAEGQSERARLISEGQLTADTLVAEAEAKHREVMENLEVDKATLETDVEALRAFEAAYRVELRQHLEHKLTELERTPGLEPVAVVETDEGTIA